MQGGDQIVASRLVVGTFGEMPHPAMNQIITFLITYEMILVEKIQRQRNMQQKVSIDRNVSRYTFAFINQHITPQPHIIMTLQSSTYAIFGELAASRSLRIACTSAVCFIILARSSCRSRCKTCNMASFILVSSSRAFRRSARIARSMTS